MDAHQQQTERPCPTQTTEAQAAAWQTPAQTGMEPTQAGTHRAVPSSKRFAVLKKPAFWRRIKQRMLPEKTWLAELMREAGPKFGGETSRRWLKRLNSSNAHIRQDAQRAYHSLPPAARLYLTAEAYIEAVVYTSNIGAFTGFLAIAAVIASGIAGGKNGLVGSVILTSLVSGTIASYLQTNRRQELAKNLLDDTTDVRLLPFLLLRLLPFSNDTLRRRQMLGGRNLRNALVRLLPLVQEADAAEWTGTHWNSLLRCLRKPYTDIELTEAVLQTMARVGSEEAYRAIKGMGLEPSVEECLTTGRKRAAQQANQQFLTQAKQECLPVLEARLHEQRQAQTLLRPSGAAFVTVSGSDVLLRPAQAYVGETPAEQLLRPQSPE